MLPIIFAPLCISIVIPILQIPGKLHALMCGTRESKVTLFSQSRIFGPKPIIGVTPIESPVQPSRKDWATGHP